MRAKHILATLGLLLLTALPALANGQIEGKISNAKNRGIGGVTVVISETGAVEITGNDGRFRFDGVPAGTYNVSFTLGDNAETASIEVADGGTVNLDRSVDWDTSFAETITVFSASRRRERIVDAPAAVTVISQQQLERESSHGQLPKLLEHSPGAEATQNGLYDFNFNSRGFNSSLNRRILTLIDGRNPSVGFLGSQEWTSLTVPLDELQSVELVRGPGSALYGADAFNGVVNMVTKSPRDSRGGRFKLTGGDLSTARVDFSQSGELGGGWFGRIVAGYLESGDFSRSRLDLNGNGVLDAPTEGEYPGLNVEVLPLPRDENEIGWGNLRADKFFDNGHSLALELGYAEGKTGGAVVTGIGRVQTTDFERPSFRVNYNAPRFNILAYRNDREAPRSMSLSSGQALFLDSDRTLLEVQGNMDFADGKGRVIGGISISEENFNSQNDFGVQTLVFEKVTEDFQGVYGQIEYSFTDSFKGVFSARYDDSSLYDSQLSPRAALVWSINPNHTLRFNYGEAFQRPNFSEYFLQVRVAPNLPFNGLAQLFVGVDLEAAFCAPFGVDCGLNSIPLLAVGNNDLQVEEVTSFELGYSGILGSKAFLTVDYYNSQIDGFITDLIYGVNPAIGRINAGFPSYQAPGSLPAPVAAQLQATIFAILGGIDASGLAPFPLSPVLSNSPVDGSPLFAALSYTNFGDVDTQGVEIGLNVNLTDEWVLNLNGNWFDFDINQQLPEDPLVANAPEFQYGFGITYLGSQLNASLKYRHVDGFDWAAGVFRGAIKEYDLVDLDASYQFAERYEIGVSVSNLFDESNYQIFGGDLIQRRFLGHFSVKW